MHPIPLKKEEEKKKVVRLPANPHFRNSFTSLQLVKFSIQRRQFYAARASSNKLNTLLKLSLGSDYFQRSKDLVQ